MCIIFTYEHNLDKMNNIVTLKLNTIEGEKVINFINREEVKEPYFEPNNYDGDKYIRHECARMFLPIIRNYIPLEIAQIIAYYTSDPYIYKISDTWYCGNCPKESKTYKIIPSVRFLDVRKTHSFTQDGSIRVLPELKKLNNTQQSD